MPGQVGYFCFIRFPLSYNNSHSALFVPCLGGGLLGDFTSEQLSRAGLAIPEGNSFRQGGLNTNPGTDSEDEELNRKAAENADIFGGEGGDTEEGDPPSKATPAGATKTQVSGEASSPRESSTTVEMTHTLQLHIVPGFDQEQATKTMFLIVLELPGGLLTANPVLDEDLMGLSITFVELGQSLDAGFLLQEIARVNGQSHMISHVREDLELEMVGDSSLSRGADNSMTRTVHCKFPEKADVYLFNPRTHSRIHPVYTRHVPGGRTVVITAVWQAREIPIFRGVDNAGLTRAEQMQRARLFFPDIQVGAGGVAAAGGGGRNDADLIRNLRERVERQEAQLRREYNTRINEDRARLQARVAGMTGDQIRNLSQQEFRELFTELGAEFDRADAAAAAGIGRNTGRDGVHPVEVEDVYDDNDGMETEFVDG